MKITWGEWKGWELYIKTKDRTRLPEHRIAHYAGQGEEPPTTEVFIEYRDGQEFAIYAVNPTVRTGDAQLWYRVDGRVLGDLCPSGKFTRAFAKKNSHERWKGQLWAKNLRFEPLKRVEQGFMVDEETEKQLGTITVTLERGTVGKTLPRGLPFEALPPHSTLNACIKPNRLSSYVGGRNISPTLPAEHVEFTLKANPNTYKVVFHYFTRKVLMAMEIIPNPNSTPLLRSISRDSERLRIFCRKELYYSLKDSHGEKSDYAPSVDRCSEDEDAASSDSSEFSLISMGHASSSSSSDEKEQLKKESSTNEKV